MSDAIDNLTALMAKATPLPWTGQFLGGRELADAGILADVESVSSPFARAAHIDDLAFTVTAVNAIPALLTIASTMKDLAEYDCEYGDNCPTFGTRHGQCVGCMAREALDALTPQEPKK